MEKLFIDTNIMLDFLGEREPFYESIAKIATLAEKEKLAMVVSPISFATVNYFLSKFENSKIAREKLRKFKVLCSVCALDEQTIEKGLNSSIEDFEDALQYFSATDSGCDIIITRNGKDFKQSLLPVMTAEEFLSRIGNYTSPALKTTSSPGFDFKQSLSTQQSHQHHNHADQKHENADAIDAMHHFQIDVVAFAFAKHGHRVQVS